MVADLEVGELEPVGGRDRPPRARCCSISPRCDQLLQRGQRHAGVRAGEHAGAVGARRGVARAPPRWPARRCRRTACSGRMALSTLTGLPIWMALARVVARPGSARTSRSRAGRRGRAGWRARPGRRRCAGSLLIRPRSCISSKPAPSAEALPRLPPGMMIQSGTCPVELLDDLDADRLLALDPQRVHRVGEVDAPARWRVAGRSPCSRRSRCRARAPARRWRSAGPAARWRSCRAGRSTTAGMPAAAQ